ncbi:MAG: hypothetical protein M1838_005379 [Thelocarpon superellum]|nr:MAG: hypothetical protein M1838_005379 [Thelocarpon superellum]
MADRNVDVYAARLADPHIELKLRVQIATELRDSIEYMTSGQLYVPFLKKMVPVFLKLLDGPAVFLSTSAEQRLRNCVLEILHRLPMNPPEALEPYAAEIVDLLMDLVQVENEDNAVLCMKTIMDLQRQQTKVLADRVQPFLDLIQEMFQTMDQAVHDTFDNPAAAAATTTAAAPANVVPSTPGPAGNFQSPRPGSPMATGPEGGVEPQTTRQLLRGMQSFKVLAECPIIVVSLFQAHRSCVHRNVKAFVPLIKAVLMLQAGPQERAHQEAKEHGRVFTGVSPQIKNRAAFGEFIMAQVKTMSFLAYLLRVYAQQLTDFLPTLPEIVVRLLQDCPRERSSARKELLVAIRHIINFNFRKIFLKQIDALLDEKTLIGDGLTVYETMRPLAYSMLADLIHHVRDALNKDQIRRTIQVYTKNLHDDFPGTSFQTMSAKLLLNMADCIARLEDKRDARHFLIMILNAIADKFAAMNRQYDNAVKVTTATAAAPSALELAPEPYLADQEPLPDWDAIDIFHATPIKLAAPRDRGADPVADNKFLFKNLMNGLKNMFYQLKVCNPPPARPVEAAHQPPNWHEVSYGYDAEEVHVITKLFREGAHVFRYYRLEKPPKPETTYASPVEFLANHYMVSSGKQEKELLETFATVFHCIDPATFHEVFHAEIPRLYDMMFEHTALLHVPQFFLASEATSPAFAGMLLAFLMARIEQVGAADVKTSSILLRLFKLSFMAVTLFSAQNEQVLLPHVATIVTQSLTLARTAAEPLNYFLLLRSLFRSIGGGRFELLYKELLPLLEMLLETLNHLLGAARKPAERDLYVELCLTVPARLSNLLPHLSYLMRPLVVALRAGSDLVGQGLRTLELCVDNLTADYLDPIMAPVMSDLMTALWEHLRPAPYPHFHAHTTMRILGKLGGRNRKFLTAPPRLAYQTYADDRCSFDVRLVGAAKDRAWPATVGLERARTTLTDIPKTPAALVSDAFYKQQAWRLLRAQLILHLGRDPATAAIAPDDLARRVRLQATDWLASAQSDAPPGPDTLDDAADTEDGDRAIAKRDAQEETLQQLFQAGCLAMAVPALAEEATTFMAHVVRHVALLDLARALAQRQQAQRPFDVHRGEGPVALDGRVLADALVAALASDRSDVREAAATLLETVRTAAGVLLGAPERAARLPFFAHWAKTCAHSCHEEEWYTKAGGARGIHLVATRVDLGDAWLADRQLEFVRALLYVIKDMPPDLPATTRRQAQDTLELLLRRGTPARSADAATTELASPSSRLSTLASVLVYELAHMNPNVRAATQRAFALLAEVSGVPVYTLLGPVKDRLLSPIYNKPLRALPFATQIGCIDAIAFCVSLQHDLVPFGGPLDRLLMEALALADADDESLAGKPHEHRTAEALVQLRVACIRLLSMAMSNAEFGNAPQNQSRPRIIAVFFKSLYAKSPAVIDAANEGLKQVLTVTNKLPKDLLQNGLRPILMNLQDPKRLTVAGLDGLARLLTLLTNYFKVEIGTRLIDHMETLADAATLQKISFTLVGQHPQMKIVTAILNVFYLLPPAAITFMPRLVDKVLDLEDKLRRTQDSPFRAPLLRYLTRYPQETWAFFAARLSEMRYGRFLAQLLAAPGSEPLRDVVMADVDGLVKAGFARTDEAERDAAAVNGLHLIYALVCTPPPPSPSPPAPSPTALPAAKEESTLAATTEATTEKEQTEENAPESDAAPKKAADGATTAAAAWLVGAVVVRQHVLAAGRRLEGQRRRNAVAPALRLAVEQAGEQVMDILTAYLAQAPPAHVDVLFEVIEAVTADELQDTPALYRYLYDFIITSEAVDYRRGIILRCLDLSSARGTSALTKTFAFRYLVNPIFAMDIQQQSRRGADASPGAGAGAGVMDRSMTEAVNNKVWKAHLSDLSEEAGQPGVDHARLELLQLSALLIKYHRTLIAEVRKDVIKFGWTSIRLEDVINKHAAYVVIAYFIAHYDCPAKIIIQIYVALLKAHQNEGRALVTQALELIAGVLPKRVGGSAAGAGGGGNVMVWAKWPKRILLEENGNLPQLTSIFHFLVRHPALFYDAREQFAPTIVQSLQKIAPSPNPSNESKKLALNLVRLIWQWEERRVTGGGPSAGTGPTSATNPRDPSESPSAKKRKLDGASSVTGAPEAASPSARSVATTGGGAAERGEYVLPPQLKMVLIKYLVHFITSIPERFTLPAPRSTDGVAAQALPAPVAGTSSASPATTPPSPPPHEMVQKALQLFEQLLGPGYWTELDLDLFPKLTEPILASSERTDKPDEKMTTSIINTLQVVRILVLGKPDDWVLAHISQLAKLLEKPLRSENPEIQEALHRASGEDIGAGRGLIKRILDAIPEEHADDDDADAETSTSEFITLLSTVATETLSAGQHVASINILWTLAQSRPGQMDEHLPNLMKALSQKLARDHVAAYGPGGGPGPAPAAAAAAAAASATATGAAGGAAAKPGEPGVPTALDPRELEIQTDLILKAIEIIAMRMATLGEQRRPFLSVLASLVEKSQSTELCLRILSLVEGWVFDSTDIYPTLKEKTAVLHKMLAFETRPDPKLLTKFLDLVIRIYEDPHITRTELTVRLEHAFLVGTRAQDVAMRQRFMFIFDRSLSQTASARLHYVVTSQNWDTLADSYWLHQATQLLLGAIDLGTPAALHPDDITTVPLGRGLRPYQADARASGLLIEDALEAWVHTHAAFVAELSQLRVRELLEPLSQLQHVDDALAHALWTHLFPLTWSALAKDDRAELERGLVTLLTKDFHQRQVDRRPNVVQTLLEGAARAQPRVKLPPHVVKFVSRTYDAWYTALHLLEDAVITPLMPQSPSVQESTLDALVEVYAGLQEDDLFYGTWRRRCQFVETNAALSYEQQGVWDKAQGLYETAQMKARSGAIPFAQGEYMLWEDHWVRCAQKLQQWEILLDFAKHENFSDLLLECAWRQVEMWTGSDQRDWLESLVKGVMDAPTPRRAFFQAFLSLLRLHAKTETTADFSRVVDEAVQLSIRKWHQLPRALTQAHVPLLQNFQQLVELHDASLICASLAATTPQNLDGKSQELKLLLATWRDRLPNVWDDINAWQDLVTWRQHIFHLINTTYLTLLPQPPSTATGNSFAYRGYHETAWIINRFAHVARKHQLPDVCINQLSRIYTLPNIEIQEAFLKLREQAKCHYQNRNELTNGLDVINNTNLNYFGAQQKAEFFTLKGMFLAKLQQPDEANEAFGTALFYDIKLPKAWAEWGRYNDANHRAHPTEPQHAAAAVSCYLEAAGLFKNAKSRKLLGRILWLLSLDDAAGSIAEAFEAFKGETPVWYWITFIPQLLTSLSHREARLSRAVLLKIAKAYPQALYFLLRTTREDMAAIKKQQEQKQEKMQKAAKQASPGATKQASPPTPRPGTANGSAPTKEEKGAASPTLETNGGAHSSPAGTASSTMATASTKRYPWEFTEEIMSVLKTAFPLLALSMETMVDQIQKHFKCQPDEDAYRLIVALLNDGLSYVGRMPTSYAQDVKLPPATEANITRFAETILPAHIRKSFEADFVTRKPTMHEYIQKLRRWRDKFEEKLDRRPTQQNLEQYSPHLSEFRFQKFDEVEVPGQYLQHRDKNHDFIRIERFLPKIELVRGIGVCHRRLRIRGHDGSVHPFAIQHPAARHCRREERILQLFRIFNGVLVKRKESRRRNLAFHLPLMVPLAPHIRLVQDDESYVTLQGVYEDHCRRHGMNKDEPVLFTMEKLRALSDLKSPKAAEQASSLRMEAYTAIQQTQVPSTLALSYFTAIHPSFDGFWLFRRHFSYQLAALTFMTYIMHMNNRYPHKLSISRASGQCWGSELIPAIAAGKPFFHNPEPVPFRLTPNLQTLLGPLALEGIFSCAMMALARCLTEPTFDLDATLSIFVRDEMIFWFTQQHRSATQENQLRETVSTNSEIIVKKASSLAKPPVGNLPANQTVIDLIAKAVNPVSLAQSDALWMPYL